MEGVAVQAIADFTGARFASADNPELSFKRGDTFTVLEIDEVAGWAKGQINNTVGWFPTSYVHFVEQSEGADNGNLERECVYPVLRYWPWTVQELEAKEKELCDQEQDLKNQLAVVQQQKRDVRTRKADLKSQLESTLQLMLFLQK